MFDVAEAAVQAALAAGARYADARVMHRRSESMTARNGDDRGPEPARGRRRRRAGAGRVGLGLLRRARPGRRRGARGPASGPPRSPRRQRAVPGPAGRPGRRPRRRRAAGPATCEIDPLAVPLSDKGDLLVGATATMRRARRRPGRGHLPDLGHRASGSSPARATASTSTSASAAPAITATAIGDGETQRRSYPASRGQYGTRGWELVDELDLPGARRADRRGGAGAAHRAAVPGRRDHADPRRRAAGAADPRVGRPRHRARPHPRLGGGVRRHVLARPRPARLAAVRLGADEHHHRPDDPRRARLVRLRRRGHAGGAAGRGARRASGSACWPAGTRPPSPGSTTRGSVRADGWARLPMVRMTNVGLEPGPAHARRDHRRHRRRDLHGHQPLLVDRRPAAELPVRLRGRLRGQERPARPDAAQPDLHRHRPAVLVVDGHARRRRSVAWGTPNCGKGQPGQVGHTGHPAAPARFRNVRVGVRG